MRLTDKEVQMFRSLHQTEVGKVLLAYLERLDGDLGNVRTIPESEIKVRKDALKLIEEHITNRIKMVDPKKDVDPNIYA